MKKSPPLIAIRQVAVLGSGVMGAGIAGLIASAGYPVLLLDRVVPDTEHRNSLPAAALMKLKDQRGVLAEKFLKNITIGNFEDDLSALAHVDWVVEVVVEQLAAKHELYAKIQPYLPEHAILSSNTSTIPLAELKKPLPDKLRKQFCITHFFNPPIDMPLVELVTDGETAPAALALIQPFLGAALGKEVVCCHDTPGFIANRIGCYFLEEALREVKQLEVPIEEADAVFSSCFGLPSTGVFGLWDLIGIDLMPKIAHALIEYLPPDDAFSKMYSLQPEVQKMIAEGYTGRKGKGGFYRIIKHNGGKRKEARNLQTGEYASEQKFKLPFANIWESTHRAALYGQKTWLKMLSYALSLVGEVADDLYAIDVAMRCGYAWQKGPFAYVDTLAANGKSGPQVAAELFAKHNLPIPSIIEATGANQFYAAKKAGKIQVMGLKKHYILLEEDSGYAELDILLEGKEPVFSNSVTQLIDMDKQVLCLLLTSKMGVLSEDSFHGILNALKVAEKTGQAILIANLAPHFCAGADIAKLHHYAEHDMWKQAEELLALGQRAMLAVYQAKVPVVAAVRGAALGGGCEILLHSHAVQSLAKVRIGLVEANLGLIPGWAGGTMMLYRALTSANPAEDIVTAYNAVAQAMQAFTSYEAAEYGYLNNPPAVTMHPRRLHSDALAVGKMLLVNFVPRNFSNKLTIPDTTLLKRKADILVIGATDPHDQTVRQKLLTLFTAAGDAVTTVENLHKLERKLFIELLQTEEVLQRMQKLLHPEVRGL